MDYFCFTCWVWVNKEEYKQHHQDHDIDEEEEDEI